MAVYREKRGRNPLRLALGVGAILVALGLLAAWLRPGGKNAGTPETRAVAGLGQVRESLDLFSIEYPKLIAGQPSGAAPALARARSAFDGAKVDLAVVDPAAPSAFGDRLTAIERAAGAHAPPASVRPDVERLRADLAAWMAAHAGR